MDNYFNGRGTFGFTCDVCGRKVNGCHYINGMSFCEKCYQETFGKDNQQNEIQQLKQQLEEKDKLLKCYQEEEKLIADILGDKDLTIIGSRVHLKNLIVELRNKIRYKDLIIEEKDKENEKLKLKLDIRAMSLQNINIERMEAVRNQTQLAIQELEKVKEEFGLKSGWSSETDMCFDLEQFIKQQIKELKGE